MNQEQSIEHRPFVIIAGTSKAGTTSVYNYLAAHSDVNAALAKETRFFLDESYPLSSSKRFHDGGIGGYSSFFLPKNDGTKSTSYLEATPDYLYSYNTAEVIRRSLRNVRLIFILREPVSRLRSWYRFGQAMGEIPLRMTFDEWIAVQAQHDDPFPENISHPAFAALQHGRYSMYLKPYFELFGNSLIHVGFYEELRRDPLTFMTPICHWLGLDGTYSQGYRFDTANKGRDVRSTYFLKAYWKSKEGLRRLVRYTPKLRPLLRKIRLRLDATYEKLNVVSGREITISSSTKDFILSYYRDEPGQLRHLFGIEVPWGVKPANHTQRV